MHLRNKCHVRGSLAVIELKRRGKVRMAAILLFYGVQKYWQRLHIHSRSIAIHHFKAKRMRRQCRSNLTNLRVRHVATMYYYLKEMKNMRLRCPPMARTVFIPSFVKISQLVQKLKWGDTDTLKHVNTMAISRAQFLSFSWRNTKETLHSRHTAVTQYYQRFLLKCGIERCSVGNHSGAVAAYWRQ